MNIIKMWLTFTGVVSLLVFSSSAFSHQTSTGYFTGELSASGAFSGELQVRLFDLERVVQLDRDANGELTWGEALSRASEVEKYLESSLSIQRQSENCETSFSGAWKLDKHFNEPYLVLPVNAQCAIAGELQIAYSSFFDYDSEHKLLFSLSTENNIYSRVISGASQGLSIDVEDGNLWLTFKEFTKQGAIHIWIGIDHILFLMCLLLASVFTYSKIPSSKNNIRQVSLQILTVVTAFTIAHSITLAATALNWINVSSSWVEVGIALSVLAAALNNVFPVVKKVALITFAFGLLHGMGFAGVLGELGLPADQKWLTVLAFNIGVEFGQIVIILAALPILFLINRYSKNPRYFLVASSVVIALISFAWVIERLPF